nr:hypothetical protein [Streptomyces mobaraensis]
MDAAEAVDGGRGRAQQAAGYADEVQDEVVRLLEGERRRGVQDDDVLRAARE